MIEAGLKGEQTVTVTEDLSAKTMGSGTLDVFATPALIALMEKTAWMSVADALGEDEATVGTALHVDHVAPTPLGMTVRCESTLVGVDGRALHFEVQAFDEAGLIGKGTHDRFIVGAEKFQSKANAKRG